MLTRRALVGGLAAVPLLGATPDDVAELEQRSGGRMGVVIHDSGSAAALRWRADERFPLCSVVKLFLAAAVLARVDAGTERLARRVPVNLAAVVGHAPVTRPLIGGSATLATLCQAAMTVSDNGAANLLFDVLGGPAAVTAWLRTIGDGVTRLDRIEPALNECRPGDPRDTTTTAAAATILRRLTLGKVLKPQSRVQLNAWLAANTTGGARLRAGVPSSWLTGDKTGTSSEAAGTSNDIAVLYPPARAPIVVAAFLTRSQLDGAGRDGILAAVGRIAATI